MNSWPLTKDHNGKGVDLCFTGYHYLASVKANKRWQLEQLNPKPVCMVEVIPLAAAIFWHSNFLSYTRQTFNLAKKLILKTKNLRVNIVKKRIRKIRAQKTIAKLDLLYTNNPNW